MADNEQDKIDAADEVLAEERAQSDAQLTPSEDKGSERNQPARGEAVEAYGDEPLAASTPIAQRTEHFPGQPLETVKDREANEALREERRQLAEDAELDPVSDDDPTLDTRPVVIENLVGGVDTRSPEANYLTRSNIVAPPYGGAVPLVPPSEATDEDGVFDARKHEALEAQAEREFVEDHLDSLQGLDLSDERIPGPVLGPR